MLRLSMMAFAGALLAVSPASAALIDFEDANSKGLSDDDQVTNEYWSSDGVRFIGGYIEDTMNDDPNGFLNDQMGQWDQENPPSLDGLGEFFLRTQGGVSDRAPGEAELTIVFAANTVEVSGQLWDIDGNNSQGSEQWRIDAWADGAVIDSHTTVEGTSNGPGSLDGLPYAWGFSGIGEIDQLTFTFTGSKDRGIGLAFDNFQTGLDDGDLTDIPEPGSLVLLGAGLIGLGAMRRRRKA